MKPKKLIFLGCMVLASVCICSKSESQTEPEISKQIETLFADLRDLEEQKKVAARQTWQSMSIQDRAWFLYPKPQQVIPKPDFSEKEAIEIIENAKKTITEDQFKRRTESPNLLSSDKRSEFIRKREHIVENIVALGESAIPLLLAKVKDITMDSENEKGLLIKERVWALTALVKIGKPARVELVKVLEEALQKKQTDRAIAIMWALRKVRADEVVPVATKYLEKALREDQIPVKPTEDLIWACSCTRSKDVVPLLIRAVECKKYINSSGRMDDGPRIQAIKRLGLIGDEGAANVLMAAAKEPDGYIRFCAVGALERCGTEDALELLEKIAKTDSFTGKGGTFIVRSKAEEAIKAIKKRTAN